MPYMSLLDATACFSSLNEVGNGGFGSVYSGDLDDGRKVAVKRMRRGGKLKFSTIARSYRTECEVSESVGAHEHVVRIVGKVRAADDGGAADAYAPRPHTVAG